VSVSIFITRFQKLSILVGCVISIMVDFRRLQDLSNGRFSVSVSDFITRFQIRSIWWVT